MDYATLRAELTDDPLTRGYSGMTDAEATADLLTEYRSRIRASMSGDELFAATAVAEFVLLTDHQQQLWVSFCARDTVNPGGTANVAFVTSVFGAGSTTLANLAADRQESISRAVELGLGHVREGDVLRARS